MYDFEVVLSTERVNQKLEALQHDLHIHLQKLAMTRFFCVFGATLFRPLNEVEKNLLEQYIVDFTIYRFRCALR
jgi:hypothetical protein